MARLVIETDSGERVAVFEKIEKDDYVNLAEELDAAIEAACKQEGREVPGWLQNAQKGADI